MGIKIHSHTESDSTAMTTPRSASINDLVRRNSAFDVAAGKPISRLISAELERVPHTSLLKRCNNSWIQKRYYKSTMKMEFRKLHKTVLKPITKYGPTTKDIEFPKRFQQKLPLPGLFVFLKSPSQEDLSDVLQGNMTDNRTPCLNTVSEMGGQVWEETEESFRCEYPSITTVRDQNELFVRIQFRVTESLLTTGRARALVQDVSRPGQRTPFSTCGRLIHCWPQTYHLQPIRCDSQICFNPSVVVFRRSLLSRFMGLRHRRSQGTRTCENQSCKGGLFWRYLGQKRSDELGWRIQDDGVVDAGQRVRQRCGMLPLRLTRLQSNLLEFPYTLQQKQQQQQQPQPKKQMNRFTKLSLYSNLY